ncbi:MAG: hypothetical protein JWR09_1403 [Mucilaginibacter sp.]|jgi:hypothetical protein|nr:hypothetical protein [Mucilaginibacter sp.]
MAIILNEKFNKLPMTGSTQWYEIKVNVESDNLYDIDQVEYYLDRSVSPSVMVSENPDNKFEIQMKSWKEFPVSAKIIFKDHSLPPEFVQTELSTSF